MYNEWPRCKLGQVCRIRYGKDHKKLSDGHVPVYGSGGVMRHVDTALYASKSVLIPRKGSLDNLFLVSDPFWTVDTLFYTEIDETQILPEFFYYQLLTLDLKGMNVGSAVPSLTTEVLNEVVLVLPPLPEQRAIASILGALDDKIDLNRKIAATLDETARIIFTSWFVRFDPVRAKAEGRQPEGMDAATAALFPDRFVSSELGEIPEGWGVQMIEELIQRVPTGQKYSNKSVLPDGRVPVLDQKRFNTIGFHNEEPGISASPTEPVILFSNHRCYMKLQMDSCSVIQNVLPFVGKHHDVFWTYFATLGKQEVTEYKGHWPDFVTKQSIVPATWTLTSAFGNLVAPNCKYAHVLRRQSEALAAIRDVLLPKLMSGGIRIGAA